MSVPLTIENCWLAVSVDDNGDEGVCAVMVGGTWMPLLAADRKRVTFIEEQAQLLADMQDKKIKIIRLTERSEIRTIRPSLRSEPSSARKL